MKRGASETKGRNRKGENEDERNKDFQIPCGIWPDEREERNIGKLWLVALLNGVEGYLLRT